MSLLRYRPAAPLDRFVECFWWSRRDVPQTYEEHMLAQLVISLHETPLRYRRDDTAAAVSWSGGLVHGPQHRFYVGGTKPCGAVVGVSFRAGSAGASVVRPLQDQFYGERSGTVRDPFGHEWLLGGHLEQMSTAEMQRRYTELFKK